MGVSDRNGNGNKGNDARTKEILDLCLSSESPEVKAKVYEIVVRSGLDPNDPMFLVLALSGQMRVFLEAAPKDLGRLLTEWKNQSASSLAEIATSIASIEKTNQEQALVIKENMEAVSLECVSGIKKAGMATTSAIASANNETLETNRKLTSEIVAIEAEVKSGRLENTLIMRALMERLKGETEQSNKVQKKLNNSISAINDLQQKTLWLKFADWFSPLLALAIFGWAGFFAGGWLTYQKYNGYFDQVGRDIMDWNTDRYVKCVGDDNPKCTFWIVPPEQRE